MNLFEGHGTGAIKLPYDWRDRLVHRHPSVAVKLASFPDILSLRKYQTGPALNQGATGACVAASEAHLQAFYESMERGTWITFDWARFYTENGGTGSNGINTRDSLQDLHVKGYPVFASDRRYKIQSYAFVDFTADFLFAIQTVKAAIAALRPVVLALKLPDDFLKGMGAGAASSKVTDAYHQVLIPAYDSNTLGVFNSWGPGYGDNGWGTLEIDYLARPEQRGWLYGFTTFDAPDDNPPPPPPPPPAKIEFDALVGKVTGGKMNLWPDAMIPEIAALKDKKVHVKEI